MFLVILVSFNYLSFPKIFKQVLICFFVFRVILRCFVYVMLKIFIIHKLRSKIRKFTNSQRRINADYTRKLDIRK